MTASLSKEATRRVRRAHRQGIDLTMRPVRTAHPTRVGPQNGYILLPVVLLITLISVVAFLLNHESALGTGITGSNAEADRAEYIARAGMAHATWGAQNSGCAGDMGMTTVPFGQGGIGSYTATVTSPGGSTTAYSLSADQDAWFRSDNPTVNNGTTADMHLRMESGQLEYALYRFDLSSLPAGSQINSASAWLYVTNSGPGGGAFPEGPLTVHRVTSDWTETGATWDTMSTNYDSAVIATVPAQSQDAVWVQVNLTTQVQAWSNGGDPNFGIMLRPNGEGTHGKLVSREGVAAEQPRLDVIVGTGAASPVTITATGTLTGNPTPANDIMRSLTRTTVPAYQPPGYSFLQLQPGSGKDAMLSGFYNSRNYGDYRLRVTSSPGSPRNSLVQFNLAAIPVGAKVISAQLQLYHTVTETPGTDAGVSVHRVSRDWLEGTHSGSGSADGATWDTWDGTNAWTTAGGDYDPAPVANSPITDATGDWESWDISTLVQGWLDGSFANNGLLLKGSGTVAVSFASKEDADPTLHPRLSITYACVCGSPCLAPQGSGALLMVVVVNPTTLVTLDADKKALFESWGYTVAVIGESQNQSTYDSAVAAADVVFISETVNASQVGTKLKDVTIGVVSQDGVYNGALGFAAGSAWSVGPALNVTDNSHYITALFPAGPLDIYAAAMEQLTVSGTVAPGLQTLADTGGAGSLVVLDKGALGSGGTPLAGRRVLLPLGRDSNLNWDYLNANGRLLVQRALQWGTGNTGAPPSNLLLVVVDPSALTAQEAAKKTLIESWGYTVNLIDESDSQVNFDAAIAANDVAYIPQDINSTNLGTKLANATIGVVNEEGEQVDELGIAQDKLFKSNHEIDVVDSSHYITQPFATGFLTFVSSDQSVHMLSGQIAPGLQTLGQTFNTGSQYKPSLATLDAGDELFGGGNAAGRRVELPWGGGTFDINLLTDDGRTIMQRAIEWGAGAGSGVYTVLMVVSDPGSLTPAAADRKALMESWGYAVTLIDDDDTPTNFLAGISAADVIYVGAGATATTNVIKGLTDTTKGVVNEPILIASALGFASSATAAFAVDALTIVDGTHSITQGFTSPVTVFTALAVPSVLSGTLSPDLQNLATALGAPALATLEAGASYYGGGTGTVAGPRAQLPFEGAVGADLTADGQLIVQRAIEWAATPPPPSCNADYTPDTLVDEIPTTTRGLAYLPEGTTFSGATAPTGGAWVIVDASETIVMTDQAGNPLATCTLSIGVPDNPEGVTFVESGLWADHLAIMVAGLDDVLFLDAGCSVAGSFSTNVFSATSPTGIAFIGQTASGTYEGYLAIANMGSQTLHVVDQNGTQSYAIDVSALVGNVQGVVHIPATDKLLLADSNNGKAVIIDFVSFDGTALAEYDIAVHGMPGPDAAAINRATCDHVFGDSNTNKIISLNTSGGGGGGSPPACEGTLRDEFNAQVWSGSDGTLSWATDWLEWGEGGTPTGGDIMVMDDQGPYSARVRDNGTSSNGAGIRREADLSAYATATLSFDYRRDGPDNANDYVTVDVSDNGGATWTELDRFIGEGTNTADPDYVSTSYDISAYMSVNTRIRFLSSPNFGNQDVVYFDNVEICVVN